MEKGKRALVLMLSVLMLFSTFPASVFAGDEAASEAAPAAAEAQEPVKEAEPEPTPQPEESAEPAKEEAAAETPAEETSESADSSGAEQTSAAETNPEEAVTSEEEVAKEEEVKYPAVTLKKTVNGVTVTLKAPEGSLPEGAKLTVAAVNRADVEAAVENKLESQGKIMEDVAAFDVTPTDKDGKEIQPRKDVTVTFSGTGLDISGISSIEVFRVSDDAGTVTEMPTSVASADTQKFSTDHFTLYVITGSAAESADGSNDGGTYPPNSKDHYYVLQHGESITLKSNHRHSASWPNNVWWVEDSNVKDPITFSDENRDAGTCRITNANVTSNPLYIKVVHYWADSEKEYGEYGWDEVFYVRLEPEKVKFTFMVQDAGEDKYKNFGEVTTAKGFTTKPPENVPAVKTVGGTSYALDGWYSDASRTTKLESLSSDNDITVYAAYQAKSVVKFDWNLAFHRDINTPNPISGAPSSTVTLPSAPTSVSKWFAGWSTSPAGIPGETGFYEQGKEYKLPEGNKEVTLYGVWNYTIKFDAQGGSDAPADRVFYDAKNAVTLPTKEPTRTGYNFAGWKLGDGSGKIYKPGDSFTPKQFETTLYAQWEAIQYNIEYKGLEGASFADGRNPEKYTIGSEDITLKNPVKEGYKFMGWTGTDLTEATKKVTIPKGSTGDRSYTATWKELLNYQLEVTPISAGEKADYPTIKEKDGLSDNVSGSQWVTSQTELDKYKACFAGESDAWDSVEMFKGTFEPGDTYYALAVIRFDGDEVPDSERVKLVESDAIKQAGNPIVRKNTNEVMIPFSATVPAGPSYKIEYDLDGGSLEEGVTNPDSYTAADTFTLNNPVKEGYMFKGWTGTVLTEPTKEVTIPKKSTGDRKYTANWKKLQNYRLKVAQINAGDKVSPPEVSEADGKQGVMASAMASWVETQEMLDLYKACCAGDSTEWDSVIPYRGTFEAGKTYYGLASLKFEEDEEPDISRVKLVETDTIKQAGKPVIDRFDRSVIIPFSAAIPAEKLDDYALNVKMINAGEQAYASTVSEADGKTAVTGVSWVEDEDELRQLVAYWSRESGVHPTRFDETFKGGETYYSLALVSFDVNETPDPSRVKLNETECIKQEGAMVVHRDENNKDENVVIVPFSAKIPEKKITISVDFGSDHSGFAANVAAHDPTNMKVKGRIVSFEAYAGENLESDGLIPLYDALNRMKSYEDKGQRLYVPYFVNGKDISNYKNFEDFNTDYNKSIDITMTEDVTVYAQWLTHTQAVITISTPACGKTTNDYPAPVIVSGDGDKVTIPDDYKGWYDVSEMVPFKGEFEGGNTYIATAAISPKFGYFFDEKDITVKDKDNKDKPVSYSLQYGYLMVNVSVEHDWDDWEETKAPTQEEDGEKTRVCKGDPSHKETRVIHHKEHTHVLEPVKGKAATCTARGQRDYYRCTADGCNYIFEDEKGTKQIGLSDTIIPPTGHKAGKPTETYTPATCNSVGVHVLITRCDNEGCTTGVLGIDVKTDPMDPDAHDWDEWKVVTPATCVSEGEETRICKNESLHKETRTIAIDKDAHDWGDWEVTKKPTTTEEGEETRVCKNDPSHKETRPIDKIKEYTITYDLNGGTLNGETGKVSFKVESGTEITLPEPSRDGYTFDYWQGSKYNAGDKYTVNEDHTFTAQWVAVAEDDDEDSDTSDTSDNGSSKKSKGVDTGDAADLMGWILLAIIAETGAAYVYRRRRDF